ncbi:xylulokinase [Elioraea sp.]|uniref:xylulokinase n=1 Tax=Elioraea sp. TaxID=2185103 RepID=UPI003F6FB77F
MFALGLDVGTTGLKGLLVDAEGRIVADATAAYAPDAPHPGWSQQDATVWVKAADAVCRIIAPRGPPAAIGLSGQMHGSVFLDAAGVPVAPAILWNDQRTAAECDEIMARTAGRIVAWTLNPPRTAFTASKILWLRNNDSEAWRRTATVLLPKDLVRFHLTGERISDVTDASGTNLLDVRTRRWSTETLDALEIPRARLPCLVESPEAAGRLSARAADATGLQAGIPFVGGAADQPAAAIGNGVVEPGTVSITLGTSGVVYAQIPGVIVDPSGAFHTFCHSVPGTWQVMASVLSAAGSLQWWRETGGAADADPAEAVGTSGFAAIVEAARAVPPGSGGLVFLPYLTGERSPHNDPEARGAFIGLTRRTTRAHMARAVMEGVAFALRDLVEILTTLGLPIREIRVAGGGVRGGLWLAILASVLNRPVVPAATPDASAYGAAMLAMAHASGRDIASLARSWIRPGAPALPDAEAAATYDRVYAVFRSLYPATREAAHTLGAIERACTASEHAA